MNIKKCHIAFLPPYIKELLTAWLVFCPAFILSYTQEVSLNVQAACCSGATNAGNNLQVNDVTDKIAEQNIKDQPDSNGQPGWTDRKSLHLYNSINKDTADAFPAFHKFYFNLSSYTADYTDSATTINWRADINGYVRWFIIEKSTDRKNFYPAGEINLEGKESEKDFFYADTARVVKPRWYYHIKAILSDGSSMESEEITVTNKSALFKAWMQEDAASGARELWANKPVKRVEIIDNNAKIVFKTSNVTLPWKLPLDMIKPGSYGIRVCSDNDFVTQLIIKND